MESTQTSAVPNGESPVIETKDKLIAEAEAHLASLVPAGFVSIVTGVKAVPEAPAAVTVAAEAIVEIPPASEPAKVEPPVVQAVPVGKPFECDPVAAKPGEIVQVITQLPPGSVLRGLKVNDGMRVSTVMVGRQVFPVAGSVGSWEECLGKVVPPQSFLILLVQNMTDGHLIARARWYVTSDGSTAAQAPAMTPIQAAVVAVAQDILKPLAPAAPAFSPTPPPFHDGASQGFGLNMAASTQPVATASKTVTPGTNEVCILIQRGECERLLASLSGGQFISDAEKPSIVRQITSALKR
jgi:hypothetical protein